ARKQSPWKTVRVETDEGKRRRFRARKMRGYLNGIPEVVALVCSEKSRGMDRRYLACSKAGLDQGAISRTYAIRWRLELYHRATKDRLGLTDAGVHDFDSLVSHVHWVYCAYLLLELLEISNACSLIEKQR